MFEKAWEMCTKAVEKYPSNFVYVPGMCKKTVEKEPCSLKYVPDWFVTREWVDMWHNDYYDDDGNHGWYDWYDKFLSGMRAIKTQGTESKNKRRVNAHCLMPLKMVGLVCS